MADLPRPDCGVRRSPAVAPVVGWVKPTRRRPSPVGFTHPTSRGLSVSAVSDDAVAEAGQVRRIAPRWFRGDGPRIAAPRSSARQPRRPGASRGRRPGRRPAPCRSRHQQRGFALAMRRRRPSSPSVRTEEFALSFVSMYRRSCVESEQLRSGSPHRPRPQLPLRPEQPHRMPLSSLPRRSMRAHPGDSRIKR